MQCQTLRLIPALLLLAVAACVSCDFFDDTAKTLTGDSGKTKTGMGLDVSGGGASIKAKSDDGNPFFYEECSAGISTRGFNAGCERKWKPLFYGCVAGGGVLAILLLSCCFCCCCAPCRKRRATGYYSAMPTSSVIVVHPGQGVRTATRGDVPMLSA